MTDHSFLTLRQLQSAHVARQEDWCPDQKPDLSFRGNELGGECGEAQNVIKKLERERHGWRGSRDTVEHLGEELADVIHCAVLCAITAGIDIEQAVVAKFNSTSEKNDLPHKIGTHAPESHLRVGLFDGTVPMADGGEVPMTAAEEVLAWLLIEKIGAPDDVSYSPDKAQEIIVQNLDQAAKQLVDGGELLLQAESVIADLTKLLQAAKEVIACASDTYKKRNGHLGSFEDDSGEKCWIVPFDAFEGLRSAVAALSAEDLE